MRICSPEAQLQPSKVTAVARPKSLQGLRIGFLDNTKPPADRVMEHLDRRLRESFPGVQSHYVSKNAASMPATPAMLQSLQDNCDVVITGFGD